MLNLKQAADRAGYSEPGFRKLLHKGKGPRYSRAAGRGHYRFRPEWVDEWQERNASPVAAPLAAKPKGLLSA